MQKCKKKNKTIDKEKVPIVFWLTDFHHFVLIYVSFSSSNLYKQYSIEIFFLFQHDSNNSTHFKWQLNIRAICFQNKSTKKFCRNPNRKKQIKTDESHLHGHLFAGLKLTFHFMFRLQWSHTVFQSSISVKFI